MGSSRGWLVVAIAGLVLASPVAALSPDEEQIVGSVEDLYRAPAGPRAPGAFVKPRCGSAVLRDAFNLWPSLSEEARQRLSPLLTPPGSTPEGVPCAPDSSWSTLETAHFRIYYRPTGPDAPPSADANANRIPDFIDLAGTYLEKAYQKEVTEMGFLPPPHAKETVYFKKLRHNGLTHPMPNQASWIELNSDILGYTKEALGSYYNPKKVSADPDGVQAGLLKAVCAHEFFHACQARYRWFSGRQADWWTEGTCDWMGNQVFPESGFYLNNVGPHLEQPHVSLFAQGDFFEYSASLFPTFLSENTSEGALLVRRVWESCKDNADIGQGLTQAVGGNLPETFLLYACYNALRNYKDGPKMPEPLIDKVASYPATYAPPSGREPQYYGASFIRLLPARTGKLSIALAPLSRIQMGAKLILIDKESSGWTLAKTREEQGQFVAEVPKFGERYSQVIVVIGNFSPNSRGGYKLSANVQ